VVAAIVHNDNSNGAGNNFRTVHYTAQGILIIIIYNNDDDDDDATTNYE
jgi:hypothetical protein